MNKVQKDDVLGEWRALLRVENRIRELEEEKDKIKDKLAYLIPQGQALYGVKHVRIERKNVPWKAVLEVVQEELVPKTKWEQVKTIVVQSTTVSAYSKFEVEKKEE